MDIDREVKQGETTAKQRIEYCLNKLEEAEDFRKDVDWQTEICKGLTIEEIIGALVSSEQELIKE